MITKLMRIDTLSLHSNKGNNWKCGEMRGKRNGKKDDQWKAVSTEANSISKH